jgi:site-specific recombinase XerD
VGNANVYKDSKRSLKRFTNSLDLLFTDIDQTFLQNYEIHLRKLGLAETSISVYFRTLRALFSKAIQEKLINLHVDPFKEFSVSKFNTATKKRAITKEEIKKIEKLEIDPASSLSESRHYFLFSYYGQGINFKDFTLLQWKNIVHNHIVYTRAKTGKIIQFKLLPPAKAIIEHYRRLTGNHPENYIFPILNRLKHVTALQIDYRVTKVIHQVNCDLKEIAHLAQIDANLTTYVARHTYATVLKKNGIPTAVISEALGHKSEFITQTYLKSFENEVVDLANECLL